MQKIIYSETRGHVFTPFFGKKNESKDEDKKSSRRDDGRTMQSTE
jgi:hypothetical protein